jgi:hypothetical protein
LESFLPGSQRRVVTVPGSPNASAAERYNNLMGQLIILRDYNRKLRENAVPIGVLPPTTLEAAIAQGFVESKVILELLEAHFRNSSSLSKYLKAHEKSIRQFRPSNNRRMVCAADFLNTLFEEKQAEDDARSKVVGEEKRRRNKTGK